MSIVRAVIRAKLGSRAEASDADSKPAPSTEAASVVKPREPSSGLVKDMVHVMATGKLPEEERVPKDIVADALKEKNKLKYRNPNPVMPQHPLRILVAGATGSGKSYWLISMIDHDDSPWDKVIWIAPEHSLKQPILQNLKKKMKDRLMLVEGDTVIGLNAENKRKVNAEIDKNFGDKKFGKLGAQTLVVLDDLMNVKDDRFFTDLFISGRHRNVSVAELSQRVFLPGRGNRTRRLNTDMLVLFRFSSLSELASLFRQLDPMYWEDVLRAYKSSVLGQPAGSYFLIDQVSPRSEDPSKWQLKYRNSSLTRVFPELSNLDRS